MYNTRPNHLNIFKFNVCWTDWAQRIKTLRLTAASLMWFSQSTLPIKKKHRLSNTDDFHKSVLNGHAPGPQSGTDVKDPMETRISTDNRMSRRHHRCLESINGKIVFRISLWYSLLNSITYYSNATKTLFRTSYDSYRSKFTFADNDEARLTMHPLWIFWNA